MGVLVGAGKTGDRGSGGMGHFFWGFEEQGVVPDIITMAKGMGNGQPLGAVITRREIAEALEAEGYFFSSSGGSPVSCQIGMAVLDVMQEEKLWENAQVVGGHFKARLEQLIDRHSLVGAVHGSRSQSALSRVPVCASLPALLCRVVMAFRAPNGVKIDFIADKNRL